MKIALKFVLAFSLFAAAAMGAEELEIGKVAESIVKAAMEKRIEPADFTALVSQAVSGVIPKLGVADEAARKDPQFWLDKIEFAVSKPDAENMRAIYCTIIAGKLNRELPAPAKIWLLKSLERVGKMESVPIEAQLLHDPDETVRETARRALAANSAKEATAILREEIKREHAPKMRAAMIEALGFKRHLEDAALFETEGQSADAGVKAAALAALAAQGIRKEPDTLEHAAQLVDLGRTAKAADIPKLVAALEDSNIRIRRAAVQAVNLNPNPEMTKALLDKLQAAPDDVKPALILVLAHRGDKTSLPALLTQSASADVAVRAAALQGMGLLGDSGAVQVLLTAASSAKGDEQKVARESLDGLRGADIDEKIASFLKQPEFAREALQRLAARCATHTQDAVLASLKNDDKTIRMEALKTLGAIGAREAVPVLLEVMKTTNDDAERDQAAKSVVAICRHSPDQEALTESIILAEREGNEAVRSTLLTALSQIGGTKALEAVHSAMKDMELKIQDAAFRALVNWPDATPMMELLELARAPDKETHRVLALRGFVRMAALPGNRSPKDTLALFSSARDAFKTPDDRKLFLSALAEIKDFGAVDACAEFISDPIVSEEAFAATVKAAKNFEMSHKDRVVAVLKVVLEHAKNKQTKDQAQAMFDRLTKK